MIKRYMQTFLMFALCVICMTVLFNNSKVYGYSESEIIGTEVIEELVKPDIINISVKHGEKVTIIFKVKDEYKDTKNLSVKMKNQKMSSKDVNINTYKENEYSVTFNSITKGESTIAFDVASSDYISTEEIYIYSTEEMDYISTVSMSSAKRLYFADMYDLGLVTELDYNAIVFGNDYQTNIDIDSDYSTSSNLYIRGYIKFRDTNGLEYPANDVTIKIYDDDPIIGYNLLKTIETSTSGYYTTYIANDDSILENGGLDIVVRVYFGNDDFHVEDFWTIYHFDFPKVDNVSNGTLIRQDVTFNANSERNSAMHIYQAGIVGFKYLRYLDYQSSYPFLRFVFPTFMGSTYYTPIVHNIDIEDTYGQSWDTALHEFGHYVADLYGLTDFWPAVHSFSMNLADEFGKDIGTMLAWSEGFATYYSVVSQLKYAGSYTSIPQVGDSSYNSYNIETSSSNLKGESNEWVIARLLYDLMDNSTAETRDEISYGERGLFDLIRDAVPVIFPLWNLSDFMITLGINESDDSMGKLLSYYKISAIPLAPYNNDTATFYVPTLQWSAGGGSVDYPNNQFTLYVKDETDSTIFSVNLGSSTSYTFTTTQWQDILRSGATYIKWNIKTEQTSSPNTGPYYSETYILNLPVVQTVGPGSSTSTRYITSADQMYWFKFTAPSTGDYTFSTAGSMNTVGEIFNDVVVGKGVSGRTNYDDNSGTDYNFSISKSMTSGQTIFIRVRGYNWTSTGSFVFKVSANTHVHDFTDHYGTYNLVKHRAYCECGSYILENHNWILVPYDDGFNQGLQQYCPNCGTYGIVMLIM